MHCVFGTLCLLRLFSVMDWMQEARIDLELRKWLNQFIRRIAQTRVCISETNALCTRRLRTFLHMTNQLLRLVENTAGTPNHNCAATFPQKSQASKTVGPSGRPPVIETTRTPHPECFNALRVSIRERSWSPQGARMQYPDYRGSMRKSHQYTDALPYHGARTRGI